MCPLRAQLRSRERKPPSRWSLKGKEQVTVTNNKEALPDTGIVTDSLPYVLILTCVIAVVVVVVIRGRNRHDD